MIWRSSYFDLASGLYVPQVVSWDPATGEFTPVEGTERGALSVPHMAVRRALTAA